MSFLVVRQPNHKFAIFDKSSENFVITGLKLKKAISYCTSNLNLSQHRATLMASEALQDILPLSRRLGSGNERWLTVISLLALNRTKSEVKQILEEIGFPDTNTDDFIFIENADDDLEEEFSEAA